MLRHKVESTATTRPARAKARKRTCHPGQEPDGAFCMWSGTGPQQTNQLRSRRATEEKPSRGLATYYAQARAQYSRVRSTHSSLLNTGANTRNGRIGRKTSATKHANIRIRGAMPFNAEEPKAQDLGRPPRARPVWRGC